MRRLGFTLLELLVALAVFAVVAALAWGGLDTLARTRHALDAEGERLAELQRGLGRLERDVRQALPRAIRNAGVGSPQALAGDSVSIELSVWLPSEGWAVSAPEVRRVAWRCAEDGLRRREWGALDRTAATPSREVLLIPGARACQWQFYPARGASQSRWPMPGDNDPLPRAVEVQFLRGDEDGVVERFRRVIELPQNWQPAP